ncbi:MAG: transglycosylase SLT domain-containing protein [Gemmatimonadaceae bacterium]
MQIHILSLILALATFSGCEQSESAAAAQDTASGDYTTSIAIQRDSALAAAATALAQGRPWRATQLIAPALADSARRSPEAVMLAAEAAGGWNGWVEVERLLAGMPWLGDRFDGRAQALLARAALARDADSLAVASAAAAARTARDDTQRGTRLVLLARALDRLDRLDSARVAYERAAGLLPVASDWLLLRAAGVTADSAGREAYYASLTTEVARAEAPAAEAAARERTGDFEGARRAWLALGEEVTALRIALETAAGPAGSDDRRAVRARLLEIIGSRSGTSAALAAVELLDLYFRELTAREEILVARSTARSGPISRAADAYERALRAGVGSGSDRLAYGRILLALNRDSEAARQFGRVDAPRSLVADALYQRARALLRTGDLERARTQLRAVIRDHPRETNTAAIALLLLGDLATDEQRDVAAREAFRDVVRVYPTSSSAPRAAFRAAIIAFAAGDYGTAATEFDALRDSYPRSEEAVAAGYWSGRALSAALDSARAVERWRGVMADEPESYYAMLAARRLGVPAWAPPDPAGSDSFVVFPAIDSAVARITLLRQLGMDYEAREELRALERDAGDEPERMLATANALRSLEESSRAIALTWDAIDEGAERDARAYRLLYPVTHRTALRAEAVAHGLDPALVAALIRQESHFNPRATSGVGARGLMQVMPSLGRTISRSLDFPVWDPVLLYLPDVNMQLGMRHLADLFESYDNVPYILAAYNAGSSRVRRWREKIGAEDPELFTERIPYTETRDYVRVVQRNRHLYESLYELTTENGSPLSRE